LTSDSIYIQLRKSYVKDNVDLEEGISMDLDKNRHVVGIEILNASKILSLKELFNIYFKNHLKNESSPPQAAGYPCL
jgi:uncharacterized protein YuzE